jgi:hypothetical protein
MAKRKSSLPQSRFQNNPNACIISACIGLALEFESSEKVLKYFKTSQSSSSMSLAAVNVGKGKHFVWPTFLACPYFIRGEVYGSHPNGGF